MGESNHKNLKAAIYIDVNGFEFFLKKEILYIWQIIDSPDRSGNHTLSLRETKQSAWIVAPRRVGIRNSFK